MSTTNTSNNTNTKTNDNEKRFKEAYSKALAEALLANEQQQTQNQHQQQSQKQKQKMLLNTSMEDIENAYKELCFDYPMSPKFEHTFALSLHLLQNHVVNSVNGSVDSDIISPNLMQLLTKFSSSASTSASSSSTSSSTSLALSNRFIQGIIDTCSKSTMPVATATATTRNDNNGSNDNEGNDNDYLESYESYLKQPIVSNNGRNDNDNDNDNNTNSATNTATNSNNINTNIQGCNLLSFVIFAVCPLICIQKLQSLSSNLNSTSTSKSQSFTQVEKMKLMNSIQTFLGSYNSSILDSIATNATSSDQNEYNDNATNELLASMKQMDVSSFSTIDTFNKNATGVDATDATDATDNDINTDTGKDDTTDKSNDELKYNDHDSLEEIWAEDSDPDDYDYGDDRYANTNTTTTDISASVLSSSPLLLDPKVLSKKQKQRPIQNIIQCLHSLLNELSLMKLSHLTIPNSSLLSSTSMGSSKSKSMTTSMTTLWDEWNVTKVLYELFFCLLKCSKEGTSSMITTSTTDIDADADADANIDIDIDTILAHDLSMLYMKPLMVLRDRALDERCNQNSSGSGSDSSMDEYTTLLHILLQSDENIVGTFASKNTIIKTMNDDNQFLEQQQQQQLKQHKQLSPSRIIGLSSFAALCTAVSEKSLSSSSSFDKEKKGMKELSFQKLHSAILQNVDEFIDCIEFIRPKNTIGKQGGIAAKSQLSANTDELSTSSSSSVPAWVRVVMSFLPILDFLTGINSRSDFSLIGKATACLKNSDAQLILQSGLFRELLLLYSTTATAKVATTSTDSATSKFMSGNMMKKKDEVVLKEQPLCSAQEIIRLKLLRSILILSVQAPSTLGKYAVRVPDLTQILYSKEFIHDNVVDSILWYALLYHLNSSNGGGGRLPQLRMKGSIQLSATEIKDICVKCTKQLCNNVIDALDHQYKQQQSHGEGIENDNCAKDDDAKNRNLIHGFNLFSNCLSQVHALAQFWVNAISDEKKEVQDLLSKILKSLTKNQKNQLQTSDKSAIPGNDDNGDVNGKNKVKSLKKPEKVNSLYNDKIRSSTKFLLLTLDNANFQNSFDMKSMSSKTD